MKYQQPSFTVPVGSREPKQCKHGWADAKGRCVFCGVEVEAVFVPLYKWCAKCHKKSRINWEGKNYCVGCLNRSLSRHRDRRTKPTLLAPPEAVDEVQSCDTSGSSSS